MTPEQLADLNRRYLQHLESGDWPAAYALAQQALAAMPGHPQILGDVALCQMRLGQLDAALSSYQEALQQLPEEANFYDGLAELHGLRLEAVERGQMPDSDVQAEHAAIQKQGLRALVLKDARHAGPVVWPLPEGAMPPALSLDRRRNVLAYSLFGANPRYCETMRLNVQVAQKLFAQWTVRVYTDASVPQRVREQLVAAGAELVMCDGEAWQGIHPLMWRFAVMQDTQVDRWLIRDADSLLSTREQAAVQDWLASGRWFHMVRDYYTHTELLLAGLLGGCGGVFNGLDARMRSFVAAHAHEMRVVDQHFLRQEVWPTVRQSLLTHDSWFGFMDAQAFPVHADTGLGAIFHVGCNLASAAVGSDNCRRANGSEVYWRLLDERGEEVCAYTEVVQSGAWRASLPMPYIQRLRSGRWRIEI